MQDPPFLLPLEEAITMTLGLSDSASGTAAAPSSFSSPLSSSLLITSSSAVAAATSASPTPQDFSTTASPVFSLNTTTTTTTTISAVTTTSTTATMGLSMSTASTITADISSTTTPTASSTNSGGGSSLLMQKPGDCELLGSFALFVQLALGALAMMSLVWKRYRERPQRPVKIWFFDASKQVFGSVLVHSANVFMAMLTSGRFSVKLQPRTMYHMRSMLMRRDDDPEAYQPNPCSWYLLNLAVDTTLGIPILIALLRIYTGIVARTPLGKPRESIQSGNYGSPPNAWWWFKQSIIYFCGLFGMKVVVLIIFVLFPWIAHVGDWALSWTEGNEELQIIFVMMLFPLIMNAMQYYIIDSFIKKQDPNHHAHDSLGRHSLVPNSDDGDDRPSDDLSSGNEEDIADLHLSKSRTGASRGIKTDNDEYDPARDGDTSTIFGSSSDHSQNTSPL